MTLTGLLAGKRSLSSVTSCLAPTRNPCPGQHVPTFQKHSTAYRGLHSPLDFHVSVLSLCLFAEAAPSAGCGLIPPPVLPVFPGASDEHPQLGKFKARVSPAQAGSLLSFKKSGTQKRSRKEETGIIPEAGPRGNARFLFLLSSFHFPSATPPGGRRLAAAPPPSSASP